MGANHSRVQLEDFYRPVSIYWRPNTESYDKRRRWYVYSGNDLVRTRRLKSGATTSVGRSDGREHVVSEELLGQAKSVLNWPPTVSSNEKGKLTINAGNL